MSLTDLNRVLNSTQQSSQAQGSSNEDEGKK
jgi:hypothetical protein